MHRLKNIEPNEIVNVSYDSDTDFLEEKGQLTHLIGVLTTHEDISAQLDKSMSLQVFGPYSQMMALSHSLYKIPWLEFILNGFQHQIMN